MIELSKLFRNVKQLPVLPLLLLELMESFSDEDIRVEDLAKKIGMDQGISAKVIRMANSIAYRRGKEVESIEQAVIRLGINQVRSIVVAARELVITSNTMFVVTTTTASSSSGGGGGGGGAGGGGGGGCGSSSDRNSSYCSQLSLCSLL